MKIGDMVRHSDYGYFFVVDKESITLDKLNYCFKAWSFEFKEYYFINEKLTVIMSVAQYEAERFLVSQMASQIREEIDQEIMNNLDKLFV